MMKKLITTRRWTVTQLAAWIIMAGLLAGCASSPEAHKNDGTLKLSDEVSQIFQTYQVLPNHRYYYTGSSTKPLAIIGIDQKYTLDSPDWMEVLGLSPEQLKKWVNQMLNFEPAMRTFGSYILSPKGETVGIWYSPEDETFVTVQPDNRVEIIAPSETRQFGVPGGMEGDRGN